MGKKFAGHHCPRPAAWGIWGFPQERPKAQNTGPELNHLSWPRCSEHGDLIPKPLSRAGERQDPASLLHVPAPAAGAAEKGRPRASHRPPTHTHFLRGLLGMRPSPRSLVLSATFS